MATTKQLAGLFRAVARGDLNGATEIGRQIATAEAERGNHAAARDLVASLNSRTPPLMQVTSAGSPLQQCLTQLPKRKSLGDLELPRTILEEVNALAAEWRYQRPLLEKGIPRRWRLLFHGPPGCGKSATASALAELTGLPIFLARFDMIIGSYLGQTAMRLREVFSFAADNPCVLLFDEVDALAKKRGTPMEVGELDRVVIAFMQELEHARPNGFLVATSNVAHSLDEALWRRFDLSLQFPKPNASTLRRFAQKYCRSFGLKLSGPRLDKIAKVGSYARAEQAVQDDARRASMAAMK
jgi:SpoVK/Ycf46/Vps4 family AAA+-type ATPase